MRPIVAPALRALAIVAVCACSDGSVRSETTAPALTVLAASSLTESLQAVAEAWRSAGNGAVTFNFDASSRLARQIEAGVPADVFVSADPAWIDALGARGLVGPPAVFLGNRLVAVVPAGTSERGFVPEDAAALADPAVRHLALAGENVPAGRYARSALGTLGAWGSVEERVVTGDDVRSTLAWVAGGNAEVGVVYATDARVEPRVRVAFVFPEASHPPITYAAAVVTGGAHAEEAGSFVAFCRSELAGEIFAAAGFTPPP